MKCQQCEKPATFHITELTGGQPQELHLCESARKTYLTRADGGAPAAAPHARRRARQAAQAGPDGRGAGQARSAGLPGVRHHVLRVPQSGPARLPARLRLLREGADAADRRTFTARRKHVGKRPAATSGRHRRADRADPPAARDGGSEAQRRLRAGRASSAIRFANWNRRSVRWLEIRGSEKSPGGEGQGAA